MSFYGRDYSLRNLHSLDPKTIKETLTLENLMKYEKYCKEALQEIATIRQEIADQIPKLQEVQTKKYISVERRKEYDGKVKVYVKLATEHKLDAYVSNDYSNYKTFSGNEKKQALEYAETLRKKYGYGVIKKNWK